MAILYKTNGDIFEMRDLSLPSLQKAVGGYIEIVPLGIGSKILVVNEEGEFMDLPVNEPLMRRFGVIIKGDAVVAEDEEIQ